MRKRVVEQGRRSAAPANFEKRQDAMSQFKSRSGQEYLRMWNGMIRRLS